MASDNHAPRDLADLSLRLPCPDCRREFWMQEVE